MSSSPILVLGDIPENNLEIKNAFVVFDAMDHKTVFARRVVVMDAFSPFSTWRVPGRIQAMEETTHPYLGRCERGGKFFMLLPRMLLHKLARSGNISNIKLISRFDEFSAEPCDKGGQSSTESTRDAPAGLKMSKRGPFELTMVQLGELSNGRQAFESADVDPGNARTLNMLQNPKKRLRHIRPRDELPRGIITEFVPELPFAEEEKKCLTTSKTSRRKATAGPSGMTSEHWKPVLDTLQVLQVLLQLGKLSGIETPNSISSATRQRRFSSLQKPMEMFAESLLGTHWDGWWLARQFNY